MSRRGSGRPVLDGSCDRCSSVKDPRSIVAAKRDGHSLPPEDVRAFVEGYTAGEISDALAAAFLMASLLRGLNDEETLALTKAMIDSGDTLRFSSGQDGGADRGALGPTVDKHSTGGVADGVTLVFAPLAAALGLRVAKLSGRGLGHTGGTLDKLESIPGMRTDLSPDEHPATGGGGGMCRRRAVTLAGTGRRRPVRAPRRHGHGPVDPADRGERDVEEARGRDGSDPPRREGGIRGVHEDAGGRTGAGGALPRARGRVGPIGQRGRDGYVAATRGCRRQRPGRRGDG